MMKVNPASTRGRLYDSGPGPQRSWQVRIGFWLMLAIGAFYLLTEHRAHLVTAIPYLPWLLLGLCPVLHLYAHGGHGGHAGYGGHADHPGHDHRIHDREISDGVATREDRSGGGTT